MTERVLPHSPELETAVLGAMLQDDVAAAAAAATLTPEVFSLERHRLVFRAAVRCLNRGIRPDVHTVAEELHQQGRLLEVGGSALAQMVEATPTTSNVAYHLRILREKAERRRIILAAEQIAATGYRDQEAADEYRAKAEAMLFQATQAGQSGEILTPARLADLLDRQEPLFTLTVGLSLWDTPDPILAEGRLVVVAGRPGMGKTSLACAILARHAFAAPPVPWLFLSCEQNAREVAHRNLAILTGRTLYETRKNPEPWDADRIAKSGLHLDEAGAPDLGTVLGKIRAARANYGIRLVVLDHIGKMNGGRKETRSLEVGDVARGLKAIAKDLHIPVLALCQLNRNVEGRGVPRPKLSDLRESGEIEQEADSILFLWTSEENTKRAQLPVRLTLEKNRDGPKGETPLTFDQPHLRFTEGPS